RGRVPIRPPRRPLFHRSEIRPGWNLARPLPRRRRERRRRAHRRRRGDAGRNSRTPRLADLSRPFPRCGRTVAEGGDVPAEGGEGGLTRDDWRRTGCRTGPPPKTLITPALFSQPPPRPPG